MTDLDFIVVTLTLIYLDLLILPKHINPLQCLICSFKNFLFGSALNTFKCNYFSTFFFCLLFLSLKYRSVQQANRRMILPSASFLQHIGRQIRNINSRRGQLVLQNEIQQIVFRAVLEVNDE